MSRFGSAGNAAWGWLRSVGPQRRYLGRDLLAGLPGAIGSVPDGMAAAILAGVNPVQGLYASFAGPITGGLTANTRLMVITTTSASALAAGSALSGVPAAQRPAAVPLVAIIAGAALVAAGLARLGRYTRFVSYSVMTGFLTGVAVNIVCGQIPDLTGAPGQGRVPDSQSHQRADPPGPDRCGVAADRAGGAGHLAGDVLDTGPGGQRAGRTGHSHRRGGAGRRVQRGPGRRRR
jgi:Sulfate permease family